RTRALVGRAKRCAALRLCGLQRRSRFKTWGYDCNEGHLLRRLGRGRRASAIRNVHTVATAPRRVNFAATQRPLSTFRLVLAVRRRYTPTTDGTQLGAVVPQLASIPAASSMSTVWFAFE